MYRRLNDFFNSENILTEEKFGFRKGVSIGKALYKFINEILCSLNNKMHIIGMGSNPGHPVCSQTLY
jgi:hypothetical protein